MTTGAIIAIVIAAVLLVALAVFLMMRRPSAQERALERQREIRAEEHRFEAEEAQRRARIAEREAEAERARAALHDERAGNERPARFDRAPDREHEPRY